MGNPVVHFEINGPDPELVAKFYSELFGWHVQSIPELEYTTIDTHGGGGINGGISKAEKLLWPALDLANPALAVLLGRPSRRHYQRAARWQPDSGQ